MRSPSGLLCCGPARANGPPGAGRARPGTRSGPAAPWGPARPEKDEKHRTRPPRGGPPEGRGPRGRGGLQAPKARRRQGRPAGRGKARATPQGHRPGGAEGARRPRRPARKAGRARSNYAPPPLVGGQGRTGRGAAHPERRARPPGRGDAHQGTRGRRQRAAPTDSRRRASPPRCILDIGTVFRQESGPLPRRDRP